MSELHEVMANAYDDQNRLPLSDEEQRILALYDKLQEVRLEIALINAQNASQQGASR
jgi:hypothetical protein